MKCNWDYPGLNRSRLYSSTWLELEEIDIRDSSTNSLYRNKFLHLNVGTQGVPTALLLKPSCTRYHNLTLHLFECGYMKLVFLCLSQNSLTCSLVVKQKLKLWVSTLKNRDSGVITSYHKCVFIICRAWFYLFDFFPQSSWCKSAAACLQSL